MMKAFLSMFLLCALAVVSHIGASSSSKRISGKNTSGRADFDGNFAGWIDPDTKEKHYRSKSYASGDDLELVMSDEFEKTGRHFADGSDPMWTAIEKSDDDQTSSGKKSLQFYNASMVTTKGGRMVISTNTEDTTWRDFDPFKKKYTNMKRHFKSGMVQGWDKFCFTGGALEVDVKFPGRHDVGGLWPAVWLLGNLGRATYESSTNRMWPWSYRECDRSLQKAQEVSGCDVTEHYSLNSHQGRGATEIDIIEVMAGPSSKLPVVENNVRRPYNSMTLQMAPGVPANKNRPYPGELPHKSNWYKELTFGKNTSINPFFYGTYLGPTKKGEPVPRSLDQSYQCDAIGSLMSIDETYWKDFNKFRLEWEPGDQGYLRWYVDGEFKFGIEGPDLKRVSGGSIPSEPSYIIFNTAISTSWGFPQAPWGCDEYDCKKEENRCGFNKGFCESLPAQFEIESVRVYQKKMNSSHSVGCNPKGYPTASFIKGHEYRYLTKDETVPKKPIRVGGAECEPSDAQACGGADAGTCRNWLGMHRCSCKGYWTGPTCQVPNYRNNFPDFEEAEEWIHMGSLTMPKIPWSLAFLLLLCAAVLVVAVHALGRHRRVSATRSGNIVDAHADADADIAVDAADSERWGGGLSAIAMKAFRSGYEPIAEAG